MIGYSHVELAQPLGFFFCGWMLVLPVHGAGAVLVVEGGNGDLFNSWMLDFNWSAAA